MRILVVDDDLPTIELMRLTLTSFGHSVVSAAGVAEGLRLVEDEHPDVILSDLTFSAASDRGEDGYALARAVRARADGADIAMVAVTGVVAPTELQAALTAGFDQVMVKPFDIESLLDAIESFGRDRSRG